MNALRRSVALGLIFGVGLLLQFSTSHGQVWARMVAENGLELSEVPAAQIPLQGTFWSLQRSNFAPLPFNPYPKLPLIYLGYGNSYLIDDSSVDYEAIYQQREAERALRLLEWEAGLLSTDEYFALEGTSAAMMSSLLASYAYGNGVYLVDMAAAVTNGFTTASFSIAGGTNNVPYDILRATSAALPVADWNWIGIGYTSNRYTVSNQPPEQAFYLLAKPQKTMVVGWGADDYQQSGLQMPLTNALQIAGGRAHSIALLGDGTVVGWGNNYLGQLNIPTNLLDAAMIACGYYHSLALQTNGSVVAWGYNDPYYKLLAVPADLTNAAVIAANGLHSLVLRSNSTVVAWGFGPSGETNVPSGLTNVVAIAAGYQHNLAVKADGAVLAWGGNSFGQTNVPTGLSNVWDVAAGVAHSLALKKDGTVVAWGRNTYGETNVPAGLSNVVAIAAGGEFNTSRSFSMALKNDNTLVLWGNSQAVTPLAGMSNVIAIAGGTDHALAIRSGPRTPVLTLPPTNQFQIAGGDVTFNSRGAGLYGVSYQWKTNGVNLAGATNATLTLTNVQADATQAVYSVAISNEVGSLVSSNAYLQLVTPPVIVSQTLPTNQVGIYGSQLTLTVIADAPGKDNGFPLAYQWRFNGSNLTYGAHSSSYTFTVDLNSYGDYSVLVSNAAGSTNANWQVTVVGTNGLEIVQQPADQYQIAGGNVTFVCGAVSTNAVTYQWQFNGTNLPGATAATLALTNVQWAQEGPYRVAVSDGVSVLASSNANFVLVTAPTITAQTMPTNQVGIFQKYLTLGVTASAPGQTNGFPLSYRWQFNGTNITYATSSNHTFLVNPLTLGTYSAVASNAAGATSAEWEVDLTYEGSYVAPGTLAYHLATNAVARTNGFTPANMVQLANWSAVTNFPENLASVTNAVWSTNFWLAGVQGLSASSIGLLSDHGGPIGDHFAGQGMVTMISPRHCLFANHVISTNTRFVAFFLDTNNVFYWRTNVETVFIGNDISVGLLNEDLPPSVGFLPVVPTNLLDYLPIQPGSLFQGIGMNQLMQVFSQPMNFNSSSSVKWSHTNQVPFGITSNWSVLLVSGDSSAPERLLIGNQLVSITHNFFFDSGPLYSANVNAINETMHYLSTNNIPGINFYQLTPFSLTNWPILY